MVIEGKRRSRRLNVVRDAACNPPGSGAGTCLHAGNAGYLQQLYEVYRSNSGRLSPKWRSFFDGFSLHDAAASAEGPAVDLARFSDKQARVLQFINAYRFRGHRRADLDPLRQYRRPDVPELHFKYYGFTKEDLKTVFSTGSLHGPDKATLEEIVRIVRSIYCGTVGTEYMHITETEQKRWLQSCLEPRRGRFEFAPEDRRRILRRLIAANTLEQYLHTKYVGQKRFSLEGGESLIPLIDELLRYSSNLGMHEVVIGMAHRGRLNMLVNVIGKLPSELFEEFEDRNPTRNNGSGDVKYHLGYSSDLQSGDRTVHVTLSFNPSHLEIIGPVVEGSVRARQERCGDRERNRVIPILIHGDAAFSGQGVVMETFSLSQTRGYSTGGTIHIIVNNQIGFTTSDPLDSRSTLYCTDVAKMVQAPIFHVNADDPEALIAVGQLALRFRMEFHKDVIIDMVCYRRHGHSETDEPLVTQPIMYRRVQEHEGACKIYSDKLLKEKVIQAGEPEVWREQYVKDLESDCIVSSPHGVDSHPEFRINFHPFSDGKWDTPVDTYLPLEEIRQLSASLSRLPEGFKPHPSVARVMDNRRRMGLGKIPADWGYAEALACASLLVRGYPVRISGQDCGRGTFFHRHAVLHDQADGSKWLPLQHLREGQARFLAIDSILSEEAVLAFEYGYSSSEPNTLVIWEAQFGDFANAAQVVTDQFISSSYSKWNRLCGLVMLLPHGYDGQGPEHSSARLERYLQLCAEQNMQVCVPSTAAQMFHLLRRQILRPYRVPLIVVSPKSLLRQKFSASPLQEFTDGRFRLVIDEVDDLDPIRVRRLLLCSGKVYYELLRERRAAKKYDTAILRIEQLYPFPAREVADRIDRYPNAREICWAQEEPRNQGAWKFINSSQTLHSCLGGGRELTYAGRSPSASPAVGSMSLHLEQQRRLVAEALQLNRPAEQKSA